MRLLTVRSWVRDPREAFFFSRREKGEGTGREERKVKENKRAHSSVVERRTAVPAVIGSNPIVPLYFFSKNMRNRK